LDVCPPSAQWPDELLRHRRRIAQGRDWGISCRICPHRPNGTEVRRVRQGTVSAQHPVAALLNGRQHAPDSDARSEDCPLRIVWTLLHLSILSAIMR
jgi:hypothetical protein